MFRSVVALGALLAGPSLCIAATWHILPDGTGDVPTIKAGVIAAAAGDTLELGCGTYFESTINIFIPLTIRSVTGDPSCTVIDGQRSGWIIYVNYAERFEMIGVTITKGLYSGVDDYAGTASFTNCAFVDNWSGDKGGGAHILNATATFTDCAFVANRADNGAGLAVTNGNVGLTRCLFADNWAWTDGGAVFAVGGASDVSISQSTLVHNRASSGAGLSVRDGSALVDHSIVGTGVLGSAGTCSGSGQLLLACCDVYANEGGDWVSCLAGQENMDGNFSADPFFCDPDDGDYSIHAESPCAPPGQTDCGLLGAFPESCGAVAIRSMSWGRVKDGYR